MKNATSLKRRRLTSLGRMLGNPGFALCMVGVMGGACSSGKNHDPVVTIEQEVTAPSGTVLISEVLYDPIGQTAADDAYQYIEISGPAGDTLEGYYVAIVNGSAANAGKMLAVVDLGTACSGPCALGSDGFLMITPSATAGQTTPAGTTRVASGYTMVNTFGSGQAQNDVSILVIESSTPITINTDVAGDGGGLALPSGATLVDGIGWREDTQGKVFGTDVKPLPSGSTGQDSPSAIVRISTCTTANDDACWFYAEFPTTTGGATSTGSLRTFTPASITPTVAGTTLPAGVTALTPGEANTAENVSGPTSDAGAGGSTSTGGATGQGGSTTTVAGGTTAAGGTTGVTTTTDTGGSTAVSTTGTSPAGGSTAVSTTGTAPVGGATAVSTTGTAPAGGSTAVSTAAGGTTVVSTGTAPAGGTTTVSTGTGTAGGGTTAVSTGTGAGGTTAASTAGTSATGGATGGATAASTAGTKATGGKTGTSSSGTKTGGTGTSTTNTNASGSEGSDSGCGCRTAGRSPMPASGLAFIAALASGLLVRRRRRN